MDSWNLSNCSRKCRAILSLQKGQFYLPSQKQHLQPVLCGDTCTWKSMYVLCHSLLYSLVENRLSIATVISAGENLYVKCAPPVHSFVSLCGYNMNYIIAKRVFRHIPTSICSVKFHINNQCYEVETDSNQTLLYPVSALVKWLIILCQIIYYQSYVVETVKEWP